MAKTLPGTTIAVDWNRPEEAETLLNSLFLAGGLMLSQVGWSPMSSRTGSAGALWPRRSASGTPAASFPASS